MVLIREILARDDLDISYMLAEGFTKECIVNLRACFAWGEVDQVIGSHFKTSVANYQVAGHGKLQ